MHQLPLMEDLAPGASHRTCAFQRTHTHTPTELKSVSHSSVDFVLQRLPCFTSAGRFLSHWRVSLCELMKSWCSFRACLLAGLSRSHLSDYGVNCRLYIYSLFDYPGHAVFWRTVIYLCCLTFWLSTVHEYGTKNIILGQIWLLQGYLMDKYLVLLKFPC